MADRTYWLDLFTGKTWHEFLDAGGEVAGFREGRRANVRRIRPGDYLLCYLTGLSRWIGVLEVVGDPFTDSTPIWSADPFPQRVPVRPVVSLTPETAVPIHNLRDRLSIFRDLKNPNAWTGHVRGSPQRWSTADGEAVLEALREAERNPVTRPVYERKLARRPRALRTKIGPVTVPEPDEPTADTSTQETATETAEIVPLRAHTEIQRLLLKLGADMGLQVWVARNDRSQEVDGQRLGDMRGIRSDLPLQFDDATNRIIEHIDVLWLREHAIVAAFEIESTTSVYSGLLRMADLIAMQPNLNIPLYLVAPDERREKVISEVNRPTFRRLKPPMVDMCRFISFSTLRDRLKEIESVVQHLNPTLLDDLSESLEAEEA